MKYGKLLQGFYIGLVAVYSAYILVNLTRPRDNSAYTTAYEGLKNTNREIQGLRSDVGKFSASVIKLNAKISSLDEIIEKADKDFNGKWCELFSIIENQEGSYCTADYDPLKNISE